MQSSGYDYSAVQNNSPSFRGLGRGKIAHFSAIKNITGCHLGGMYKKLSGKVSGDFIQGNTYKKANAIVDTLKYPFTQMPLEILNSFSRKFNIEGLYNSKLLTNFRTAAENEKYERALRGLLKNGDAFLNEVAKSRGIKPSDIEKIVCSTRGQNKCGNFGEICSDVTEKFFKLFDENLAADKPKYNTAHERTIVRVVSGYVAAKMLWYDFFNKSIKNGKTEAEATQEAESKMKQELLENGQEALSQYLMLGAFSGFANNSTFGAPLLTTALSTVFRVTSRLSTGRPLTRIKAPERFPVKILTMDGFLNSIQNKKPVEFEEIKPKEKEEKKHLLCFKNIALACLASIGAGFALRGFKNTKAFDKIKNSVMDLGPVKAAAQRFKQATVGELLVDEKELEQLRRTLNNCEHQDMTRYCDSKIEALPKKDGKYFIGEYEKFATIPILNIQVSKKELYTLPLAPLKIVKEIVSYPYKLVSSALEGLKIIKKAKKPGLKNEAGLVNTFLDFRKQAAKFDNKIESDAFLEHYSKHLEENWLEALNKETKSNVDNCNIGKLTALLGVFSSIYFSTTDDYNSTLKQTGDVDKANKDARLRGLNKIIRTSVQCVFLGLNNLFKIPYSSSLIGAGAITAACTVLTDSVSRVLSGMPFRKMNKEELEQYSRSKKEGVLKGYYDALDKLTA